MCVLELMFSLVASEQVFLRPRSSDMGYRQQLSKLILQCTTQPENSLLYLILVLEKYFWRMQEDGLQKIVREKIKLCTISWYTMCFPVVVFRSISSLWNSGMILRRQCGQKAWLWL
jgi:hypothetical protein